MCGYMLNTSEGLDPRFRGQMGPAPRTGRQVKSQWQPSVSRTGVMSVYQYAQVQENRSDLHFCDLAGVTRKKLSVVGGNLPREDALRMRSAPATCISPNLNGGPYQRCSASITESAPDLHLCRVITKNMVLVMILLYYYYSINTLLLLHSSTILGTLGRGWLGDGRPRMRPAWRADP